MDFSYTEEQQDVIKLAQQILGDQTEPAALKLIEEQRHRFDEKLWQDLAASGLLGVALSEANGGMAFGFETLCLLIEEVGRTVAPVPVIPVLVSALFLEQLGGEAFASTLADVATGKTLLSSAISEPGAEVRETPTTRAVADEEGWRLWGTKTCVPIAEHCAGVLVAAQTQGGVALFLVDPTTDTVTLQRQHVTCSESQYLMELEGTAATLLSDVAADVTAWLDALTVAYATMAVGVCDRMMRMSASYTSERQQFGVPVATFQAVGHRVADCFIDVECLRLVTQQAASLIDQGLPATDAALSAKIWTGDATHRVSQASQHVHGGIGVDRDYPLFRYCLWARQLELSAGSSAEMTACLGKRIESQFSS